ncbi:MAG TPA: NAD(P)H-binding protein [Allosphingosinicella sp.]|jgi:NADH dehydrogenase|uniref:NAD(P)H-binding protein n=1 Tax=Allosphingosinicella sp. TaxID=2823234 RepID=UPI002F2A5427
MKDRLVTVFGGGGFVGRYVVQALLQAGARVRVAQRDPRQAWYLKTQGGLGRTQVVAADITRPGTVAAAVAGAGTVINLVGVLSGNFQLFHHAGARAVAEAAAEAGVEGLVHVSAIGADPASPSAYGRSKGEGEAAVRAAFPRATIVRPSIVFGREDQFINRFAGLIAKAPVVPVLRAPVRFQPVFAGDVGEGIARIAVDPLAYGGRLFEFGGPDVVTMGELIRFIAREIGRTPTILELPDLAGDLLSRAGFLPGAPITRDQWLMLQRDNVVAPEAEGLDRLGIQATPLAAVAPNYLVRFRKQGRFGRRVEQAARP